MTLRIRARALAALLTIAGGLGGATGTALAQGPYGRNTYEDVPFNQGSLFYRPLKPNDPPRRSYRTPRRAPNRGGPFYYQPQPRWYPVPQGYYYYPQGYGYY